MTRRLLKSLPVLFGAAVALAGCAQPLAVASITEIKPIAAPKGTGGIENKQAAFAGDQIVEVRAYAYKDGQGEQEIADASCTLATGEFTAQMLTPAKVRVPLYRVQSSVLAVTCERPGFAKKLVTVAPYDAVRAGRFGAATNAGLLGLAVVAAVDGLSDNTKNDWRYPPVKVVMEALQK
jgi:hypothetical protein